MTTILDYFTDGHSFIDLFTALIVIVTIVICIEKFFVWLYKLFINLYKKKKGQEEELDTIDRNTNEIQNLSEKIEELATLLNKQYQHLDKKIDKQREHLEEIDRDGKHRDITLMRDRILAGCRYFNQNKDDEGVVHISLTDFENMNSMIQEYFKAGGNGAVKHIYENEFSKYKIDSETFDKK